MRSTLIPIVLAAALLGCRTRAETAPPGLNDAVIAHASASRAWAVFDGGRLVGSVVRYDEPGRRHRFLYTVRNVHSQDLGMVDDQGRAYRNRPHAEAEWVGTGTVLGGVRTILELGPEAEIREVSVDELRGLLEAISGG